AFTVADSENAPRVAIVNEAMAREFWPDEDPLGKRFRQSFSAMALLTGEEQEVAEFEVVGVVADGRDESLRDQARPRVVRRLAPLEELIADELVAQRIGAVLTTLFGVAGLLLTAVGLYGVLAFIVAQRTREIGVRIALGAERRTVIAEVLRRGALLAGIGAGVGIAAAAALGRTIE